MDRERDVELDLLDISCPDGGHQSHFSLCALCFALRSATYSPAIARPQAERGGPRVQQREPPSKACGMGPRLKAHSLVLHHQTLPWPHLTPQRKLRNTVHLPRTTERASRLTRLKQPTPSFVALAAKGLDSIPVAETHGPVNAPFFSLRPRALSRLLDLLGLLKHTCLQPAADGWESPVRRAHLL